MAISRTFAAIAAATTTALSITAVNAIAFNADPPMPSVAPLAAEDGDSGDSGEDSARMESSAMAEDMYWGGGYYDDGAYQELYERCDPVFSVVWGPSDAELAEMNAEVDAQIALLEEAGIAYIVEDEGDGYRYLRPADDNWREFDETLETFWNEQYGEDDEWQMSDEEKARNTAENDAMIAMFEEAGVAYEVYDEEGGWSYVEATDEAGWRLMDDFWQEQSRTDFFDRVAERGVDLEQATECYEDEQELNERQDLLGQLPFNLNVDQAERQRDMVLELITAFDDAGISYERVDVPAIEFDFTDEAAMDVLRQLIEDNGWGYDYGYEEEMMMMEGARG